MSYYKNIKDKKKLFVIWKLIIERINARFVLYFVYIYILKVRA